MEHEIYGMSFNPRTFGVLMYKRVTALSLIILFALPAGVDNMLFPYPVRKKHVGINTFASPHGQTHHKNRIEANELCFSSFRNLVYSYSLRL